MLPKPEKISKKKFQSEVEELPNISDTEVKASSLRKKRLIVGIGLSATVILSLSFSLYRYFKNTHFSVPKIHTPSLSIDKQNTSLESVLNRELSSSTQTWNVLVQDSAKDKIIKYTNSKMDSDLSFENPDFKKYDKNNTLSEYLPGGVNTSFYSYVKNSDLFAFVVLKNPQTEIKISISILGGSSLSPTELISKIGVLSQKIYWYQVSN